MAWLREWLGQLCSFRGGQAAAVQAAAGGQPKTLTPAGLEAPASALDLQRVAVPEPRSPTKRPRRRSGVQG